MTGMFETIITDDLFDIDNYQSTDWPALSRVTEWFLNRANAFARGTVDCFEYNADHVEITSSYATYEGRYGGEETVEVPNSIFFSNQSAEDWLKERAAEKRRQEKVAADAANLKLEQAHEARERAELERLQKKYQP